MVAETITILWANEFENVVTKSTYHAIRIVWLKVNKFKNRVAETTYQLWDNKFKIMVALVQHHAEMIHEL